MATASLDILLRMRSDLQGVKNAKREIESLRSVVSTLNTALATIGLPVIAIASLARGVQAMKELVAHGAKLKDTASLLSLTTDELQRLRYAAAMSGVEVQQFDVAMQRFTRRVSEARKGKGDLLKVMQEYGIALVDSNGKARSSVDLMMDYAEAIKNASDDQERLRMAFKAFDSEGAKLVNMLRNGRDGLGEFMDESNDLVPVIGEEMVEALARADQAMQKLGMSAKAALAGMTAQAWMAVETLMLAQQQAQDDQAWRDKAGAAIYEKIYSRKPSDDKLTDRGARLALPKSISETQIEAEAERIRRQALQDEIVVARERLDVARKQAAIQAEETAQRRLSAQLAEVESALAKLEAEEAYQALSVDEKRVFLKQQVATLEAKLAELAIDGGSEEELLATTREYTTAREKLLKLRSDERKTEQAALADQRTALDLVIQGVRFERELLEKKAQNNKLTQQERFQLATLIETEKRLIDDLIRKYLELADAAGTDAERQGHLNRARQLEVARDNVGAGSTQQETRLQSAARGATSLDDPTQHFQTLGDGALGAAASYIEEAGTAADRLHESLLNIADTLEGSITDGLYGLITGTMSWNDALRHVGLTIVSTILQSLIRMAVQWMIQQALMAAFGQSLQVASLAATAAMSSAALMLWTPAAVAASIATFGGAMANGPAAMMMIQASRFAAFEKGGLVDGGEQLIRVNEKGQEFVVNARATAMNLPILKAMNAGVPVSTLGTVGGGGGGSPNQSGSTARPGKSLTILVNSPDEAYRAMKNHPDYEVDIRNVVYRSRGELL